MSRILAVVLWLSIALSIVFFTHYYIWLRFVRDTALSGTVRYVATATIVVLGLSIPGAIVLGRLLNHSLTRATLWVAYTWMGAFFIAVVLLSGGDLLRTSYSLLARLFATTPTETMDTDRRLFLARIFGSVIAAGTLGVTALGLRRVAHGPEVIQAEVKLARLPKGFDGCSIVQISDLHASSTLRRDYIEAVVAMVMALKPDLIALTGDFVDGSVQDLRDVVAPLAQLQAPLGVYFVTGNHEYYSGVDAWLAEYRRLGIRVLRNERVSIVKDAESFDLAGVDDWTAHQFGGDHGADLPKALAGRDTARELILLAHQPKAIFEAAAHGVGLVLSGHTHDGQIWPFGYLVRLAQPYVAGLSQHGATQIYVNRGTGYWGPPLRVGTVSEITRLVLRAT